MEKTVFGMKSLTISLSETMSKIHYTPFQKSVNHQLIQAFFDSDLPSSSAEIQIEYAKHVYLLTPLTKKTCLFVVTHFVELYPYTLEIRVE